MEDPSSPTLSDDHWAEDFARTLSEQRARVENFLAAQGERLDQAEAKLAQHADLISEEFDRDRRETSRLRQDLQHQAEEVGRQSKDLERLKKELQQRRTEIDASEARLHHDQQALALACEEHQAEVEHARSLRQRLEQRIAAVDEQREQVATQCSQTEAQRRRIAGEFKAQRAAHLKEIERRHREVEALEAGQIGELGEQLRDVAGQRDQFQREIEELQAERDSLSERLSETEHRLTGAVDKMSEAEERLAEAERRATEAETRAAEMPSAATGAEADEDLRRRHEMALEDIRELKARNADLEKQLARTQAAGSKTATAAGGTLDWEAQKARIMATLESDFEEENEDDVAERLKIEQVVENTQEIVAAKEREIEDLQQLLSSQSSRLGDVAVGAAALGELLDQDAVIQEERENLRRLQVEWEEKLRQAEIGLSVERAGIARQRAEIKEKLRAAEELGAKAADGQKPFETSSKGEQPARGRWLTRLGLKDAGQK